MVFTYVLEGDGFICLKSSNHNANLYQTLSEKCNVIVALSLNASGIEALPNRPVRLNRCIGIKEKLSRNQLIYMEHRNNLPIHG